MAASIALITPPVVSFYSSHNSVLSSSFQRSPLSISPLSTTKATRGGGGGRRRSSIRALTLDLSGGSFFERGSGGVGDGVEDEEEDLSGIGLGLGGDGPSAASAAATAASEDKEEPQCPPGLRQYETMAVLRPDMTEDERLSLIQRYEEPDFHVKEKILFFIDTWQDFGGP